MRANPLVNLSRRCVPFTFVAEAAKIWSTEERLEFFAWIAVELCMLLVYPKAAKDDIPGHNLKEVRKEIENDRS